MTAHTNRAALYTVLNRHGEVEERGCTVAEAAITVMGYDSSAFEIRAAEDGEGFELWTSISPNFRKSGAPVLVKSVVFSLVKDRASAEAQIYREVLKHADMWLGCEVMRDADYDAMLAELAAERGEE